jgi:hypothetical protein
MRLWGRLLVIAAAVAGSPGCALLGSVPLLGERICEHVDDYAERCRNRKWAREAFGRVESAAGCPLAPSYRDGYLDGFAEFLYRGGSGEPPALPPAKYRALCYQNLAGYRAIELWFTGYREGAAAARSGGYREFVTGPTALRHPSLVEPVPPVAPPAAQPEALPTVPTLPTPKVLQPDPVPDLTPTNATLPAPPADAPPRAKWPKVVIRIDPLWLWRQR